MGWEKAMQCRGYTISNDGQGHYLWRIRGVPWSYDWNTRAVKRDGIVVGTALERGRSAVLWADGYEQAITDREGSGA